MVSHTGIIIDEKYELLKVIGHGGMSVVYLAMDRRLNKQWAVKEIKKTADSTYQAVFIQSLMAEANLMKRLDHPALPRIVDIIEERDTIFIVMDYIEGETLDRIVRETGPQRQELVIDWAKQLCDVLWYMHVQKPPVIYRDMKPANIILKPEGMLKVIDFGIAREYKSSHTTDTTVLGTRGYAPPEQHGARQTDPRSDIYALGMTLHYLLTGEDPGRSGYIYRPIRVFNPQLSGGLERIIDKCTALNPDERYQNCRELLYAFEHYEEEDTSYKKKQKKKLVLFTVTAGMSLMLFLMGAGCRALDVCRKNRDYEQKIEISEAMPYEARVSAYLEAMDLRGADVRAYIQLLDIYEENGCFGDTESQTFSEKYNLHKADFNKNSEDYLFLLYKAGTLYFYLYSGGDQSFRTRILKAYPFFEAVAASEKQDFKYYAVSKAYAVIGEFYTGYVLNTAGVMEPDEASYMALLQSLSDCMEEVASYAYADAAYIRLTIYREIADLLNNYRWGFAVTGVDREIVMELLDRIAADTEQMTVTQQTSMLLRDEVSALCAQYKVYIERAYFNEMEGS